MTATFAYSDTQGERFPDRCLAAMQVWGDLAKTIALSDEVGRGTPNADGSVRLVYSTFEMTLLPDGSFSGKRRTNADTKAA